jgi:hypothetical protein
VLALWLLAASLGTMLALFRSYKFTVLLRFDLAFLFIASVMMAAVLHFHFTLIEMKQMEVPLHLDLETEELMSETL